MALSKVLEIIIFQTIVLLIFYALNKYFHSEIESLNHYMVHLLHKSPIKGVLFVTAAMGPFNIFMIPGMNFLAVVFAYVMQNLWVSFFITTVATYFWNLVSWFLFSYCFKQKVRDSFKNDYIFKILEAVSRSEPIKTSILIKNLFIPAFYKNMFLVVLNVGGKAYFLSSLIVTPVHFYVVCLIGSNIKSLDTINDFANTKNIYVFIVKVVFMSVMIFLNIYFVYFTITRKN